MASVLGLHFLPLIQQLLDTPTDSKMDWLKFLNKHGKELTLSTLGHIEISFLIFPRKQVLTFHANCPKETICMKCQYLFSGKNKKKMSSILSSAEFLN